ncbi:MAG TPA: peptidase S41, partial [Rikenellaceae bacterium]|nr:peptidase S41 [Rikenellaceae bacterium]
MKNKPKSIKKSLAITLFLVALLPCSAQGQTDVLNQQVNKLGQALFFIQQYYLDSLDATGAVDEMITTLVGQLDPHSSYIPETDVRSMTEPLEGNFEGIGIEFAIIRDTLVVM